MNKKVDAQKVTIVAGPCSVNEENIQQLYTIADIEVHNRSGLLQKAIWGIRTVGLKSRSSMNTTGEGMGFDFLNYMHNAKHVVENASFEGLKTTRSIEIAKKLVEDTGVVVATEIMDPIVQLPVYQREIPRGKLLIWNPAVNQLGFQMYAMGIYAERNNWFIGIKNGKWLGSAPEDQFNIMEKNWAGQISFATEDGHFDLKDRIAMIQRGVDIVGKGGFRNLPVHSSAEKVKAKTGAKMFFDPSHSYGPVLRDQIVEATIKGMQMTMSDGSYLYDGILIEVGDSTTDTGQHVTIDELQTICAEVAKFRDLNVDREVL
jgi:3-deoxy-D-arabino-heptulosonate 7-phosphate (DAHP) synthase